MKTRNYWYVGALIGLLITAVPLISAVVTATGAFGADPAGGVNRIDFVWAAAGLLITTLCVYRSRHLRKG